MAEDSSLVNGGKDDASTGATQTASYTSYTLEPGPACSMPARVDRYEICERLGAGNVAGRGGSPRA